MLRKTFILLFMVVHATHTAFARKSRFFANPEIQRKAPAGFALQPESQIFVTNNERATLRERETLVAALKADPILRKALESWEVLTIGEQIPFLRKIFAIQVQVMGVTPPELVIENDIVPGPAFFEFDPKKLGPGRVFLNPKALAKENKYASLSFLIHETRHSAQFQLAYSKHRHQHPLRQAQAHSYKAAFEAQKVLAGQLSFCDFLTLVNEYEAFQYGNYILGRLTNFKVDLQDMGTFASQYDSQGRLKINLGQLSLQYGPRNLLKIFNLLEQKQYQISNP